MILAEQLRHR